MQDFWKHFWGRFLVFIALFAGGLTIGGLFTSAGVNSDWYQNTNQAPWTPPGWVFGAAWSLIAITFSVFMAGAITRVRNSAVLWRAFALQWVLNVCWNPVFFHFRQVLLGLVVIALLAVLVYWFLLGMRKQTAPYNWAVLPYAIWITIAVSLNAYIWLQN